MKNKFNPPTWLTASLASLLFACLPSLLRAAQDIQVQPLGIQTNGDPTATTIGNWGTYWITKTSDGNYHATCASSFDSTMQSQSSIPGSVYCVCDWDGTFGDDVNFGAVLPNGSGTWLGNPSIQVIDATQYAYLLMDIYWTNVTGMTTWPTIGLMTPGYGIVGLTNNIPIPTTPGWQHLVIPIDATLPNLGSIAGVCLYRWANPAPPSHAEFWIDNVQLIARAAAVPPPTLTLAPLTATAGLNIQTASTDGEWDRQSVATVSGNYSWIGAGTTPVTYSITVTNYPDTNHPYFQTQIYLASNGQGGMPGTENAPDWGEPNCIFLQIQNLASGAGTASFLWKTNDPGDNAMFWNAAYNPLATLDEPAGPNGTWTISFVNDISVTLTSPSGLSTNFSFPDAVAVQTAFPQGSTVAYFGATPNSTSNPGQGVVITEAKITGPSGTIAPIDDHFSGLGLDTATWAVRAAEPNDVSVVGSNTHWNVGWTLPDVNFLLQTAPTVLGPWSNISLITNAVQKGQSKSLLLPDAFLPPGSIGYFRLMKPVATQLQVLLPGETNAPGTVTGKIGAPVAQIAYMLFDITVNACDARWNIVKTCKDTVHFTSTDPFASLPADAALVNGALTVSAQTYFGSSGTWTITASDVTTNAVANGASSPMRIP